MRKKTFTDAHIMQILRQVESGVPIHELCSGMAWADRLFTTGVAGMGAWTLRSPD